jgi:subtilisin family serine protease
VNRLLAFAAALALCVLAYAGVAVAAHADAAAADQEAQRQVLVMLRMPPEHFRPDGAYAGGYTDDSARAARRRVAGELAAAYGLRLRGNWAMPAIGIDCFLMEDTGRAPLEHVLTALARDPRVVWAQSVGEYHALGSGDPLFSVQPVARDWHLDALHRLSTGRHVTVAVIDSGVDANHPDLAGQVDVRRNFVDDAPDVPEAHGTAVAGIIAARKDNGLGIAGVAPAARLMALRACWESGHQAARCNSFTLGKALNFALEHGAHIINLSLAGPPDRLLQSLLGAALERGVIVVGAADPQLADGGFPASYPGVIAVAREGDRHPAAAAILYAPGTDVPTCEPGARWDLVSGSSYAAAHVAGLAALIAELQPHAGPREIRRDIGGGDGGARRLARAGPAPGQTGSIDACGAMARAADACVCLCTSTAAEIISTPR